MPDYSNNQESLYNIVKTYSKIAKSLNEALNINQKIVDNLSPRLLETATLTKNITMEYNGILTSCVEQLQPLLASYNLLPQNLIANIEQATDPIQKAGDPTQPITDTSPSTPSTVYDSE